MTVTNRRVLVVGPAATGRGGISSVAAWLTALGDEGLPGYSVGCAVSHPGSEQRTVWSAVASLRATRDVLSTIRRERPDIVHLLVGPRGSLLRKTRIAAYADKLGARVVTHLHAGTLERVLMGESSSEVPEPVLRSLLSHSAVIAPLWDGPRRGMRTYGPGSIWVTVGNAVDECPPDVGTRRDIDVIFVGRLVADPSHEEGEYGVLVVDAWQNKELGGVLTDYCIEIARGWNLKRVVAQTTTDNRPMIAVFERRGFTVVMGEDSTVEVSKTL